MDYGHQRGPYHHHQPSPGATEVTITTSSMTTPPPRYVVLDSSNSQRPPPPGHRNLPRYNTHANRRSSRCLRCMCCTYCFLFVLILLLSGAVLYFLVVYNPRAPSYKVEDFAVKAFNPVMSGFTLNTEFSVKVIAENPNDHIGFIYHHGSTVTLLYKDTALCSGVLPEFYQGYRNVSVMDVLLSGSTTVGSGMQEAVAESRRSGKIPLLVAVVVPASVVVGGMATGKITVRVNCSLVVSSISPHEKIKILSTSYDSFRLDID